MDEKELKILYRIGLITTEVRVKIAGHRGTKGDFLTYAVAQSSHFLKLRHS